MFFAATESAISDLILIPQHFSCLKKLLLLLVCKTFRLPSQISPWDPESRELRAECYIRMGDPQKAIQDLTPTVRLRNDNRAAFLKLSGLHYTLGEHHESLK